MSETYYKAIRPDGTDWFTGKFRWLPEDGVIPEGGWRVEHPTPGPVGGSDAAGYLSVATIPTDCTGMAWPLRLLRVEPEGDVWTPAPRGLPNKRVAHAWRVMEERPAHEALGPQGREAVALIESAQGFTPDQLDAMDAARETAGKAAWDAAYAAARAAAWDTAREAAWGAAREAAWGAAWDDAWVAAWEALLATIVRDLISPEHYATLMAPMEAARAVMRKEEDDDTRDRDGD